MIPCCTVTVVIGQTIITHTVDRVPLLENVGLSVNLASRLSVDNNFKEGSF